MYRLILSALVIAAVACQQQESGRRVPKYAGDPKTAAIVQEARYLSGNGAFGSAYQQEDGINFKEETDADGNRRGSYSYIDPSGQRKTVNYVAGKNGFQASGDHIPTAPQPVAPTPGYTPDPRYNSPEYTAPQKYTAPQQYNAPAPRNYGGKPNEDDGQYYPELYETNNYVAPQKQYQQPQAQYQQPQPQPQYQAQPKYQSQPQYQANNIYPGVQQAQYSGVQNQQYSAPQSARQEYYEPTTPPPSRFFPPGKFSLNRAPDGYTYSFHKV
ncbi:DNA translocase FtsK [Pararge aegeria]|uniref:DNA translocase FtsK n=1 Tax=Pararge aegeria TaxID=116150 RepID=UPI0019D21DFF|nr:DNA translocase FtsK [Pararge aegeria]